MYFFRQIKRRTFIYRSIAAVKTNLTVYICKIVDEDGEVFKWGSLFAYKTIANNACNFRVSHCLQSQLSTV